MVRPLTALVVAFLLVTPASAASVGEAKASGQACEQANGYLRATAAASSDVKNLVNNVNEQRKAQYKKIANKNGVEVNQVAKLTAQKLMKNEPQFACK